MLFSIQLRFASEGKPVMSSEDKSDGALIRKSEANRLISEFNLLTDQNKTAYIRLSVFPCDFDRDAFEAVCLAPYQRLQEWAQEESGLIELVASEKAGEIRYRLPESVRTWTAEGLDSADETLENQVRFARYFACLLQKSKGTERNEAIDLYLELENIITAANIFLTTKKRNFPEIWHVGLALTKIVSIKSDRCLLLAIECFESSLNAMKRSISPENWGKTQNNIAYCCMNLQFGERDKNVREAISRYEEAANAYSERGLPELWADSQHRIGLAYKVLPLGDFNTNLRNGIRSFLAALKVRTLTEYPQEFAALQISLGCAYLALEGGEELNYSNAILCFEAALKAYTKQNFPRNWAISHHNLGVAYSRLQSVDSNEYFENALEHFRAALEVRIKDRYPEDWAQTQFGLGNAYLSISKKRWGTHLQDAIKFYHDALSVFTEQDNPNNWGEVQNNLGVSLLELTAGNRTANLEASIECFNAALRVAKKEGNQRDWAIRQNNFGLALSALGRKSKALEKFEEARAVYRQLNCEANVKIVDAHIKLAQGRDEGRLYPVRRSKSKLKNIVYTALDYSISAAIAFFEYF